MRRESLTVEERLLEDKARDKEEVKVDLPKEVKFIRADCLDLHEELSEDGQFDCVVDTLTLNSCYNREQLASEMRRLCKPGGLILLLERG